MSTPSPPGPDDRNIPRDRPLSLPEQQAFDRILEGLHGDPALAGRVGWRHDYLTVPLPKLRTVLLVLALLLAASIVVGTAAPWWGLAGLVGALILLPWLLLYAAERGRVP